MPNGISDNENSHRNMHFLTRNTQIGEFEWFYQESKIDHSKSESCQKLFAAVTAALLKDETVQK